MRTTHLQMNKQPLELIGNAFNPIITTSEEPPLVEGIPELWGHVQGLQETVEIARHRLIHQPHKPWGEGREGGGR